MNAKLVRRTIGFLLTLIVSGLAFYQLAWHRDLKDRFTDHPWQTFGFVALIVIGVVILIHASVKHHNGSALIGLVIGVIAVEWGRHILHGIKLETLLAFFGTIIVVALLWAVTCLDNVPGLPAKVRQSKFGQRIGAWFTPTPTTP